MIKRVNHLINFNLRCILKNKEISSSYVRNNLKSDKLGKGIGWEPNDRKLLGHLKLKVNMKNGYHEC